MLSISLTLATVLVAAVPTPACPLSQSVYRDVNGQGFELIWGEAISERTSSKATLRIDYEGALLHDFDLTQASGYGTIALSSPNSNALATPLTITFFDAELVNATPLFFEADRPAPTYTFIAGLGRYNYYERRGEESLVGETFWIFDRCQS